MKDDEATGPGGSSSVGSQWTRQIVGRALVVVNVIGLIALVRWLWPDAPGSAFALAAVVAAIVAAAEVQLLDRLLGISIPIFTLSSRDARILWGGFAVVLLVAAALVVKDVNDAAAAKKSQAKREAFQADYQRKLKNADVQRGMDAVRRHQEQKTADAE